MDKPAADATAAVPADGSPSVFLALLPIMATVLAASLFAFFAASGAHAQQGSGAVPALAYDA